MKPAEKIMILNKRLKEYVGTHQITYVDFFSARADSQNGFQPILTEDGVHLNKAGYDIMEPITVSAISKALSSKSITVTNANN